MRLARLFCRLLLLSELLFPLMGLQRMLLQSVDVFIKAQSGLFGIGFHLLALPKLELLRRHASFRSFLCDLCLHGGDLLGGRLLAWCWRGRHSCVLEGNWRELFRVDREIRKIDWTDVPGSRCDSLDRSVHFQ